MVEAAVVTERPRAPRIHAALAVALLALAGCATGTARSPERVADMRALEAESAARLAAEGELLHAADPEPREAWEYCSLALKLIEQGELRRGIREASKALFLGQRSGNTYVVAFAKRDLAYAYSLAGYLDRAEQLAREAIGHVEDAPPAVPRAPVLGPARKVLGDVLLRLGRPAEAAREYELALAASEPAFEPFVLVALASTHLARQDAAAARALLAQAEKDARPALRAMIERGRGQAALIERRPAEALRIFSAAAARPGPDRAYHRVWALAGAARAQQALGNQPGALDAYRQAIASAEEVRARFRSEEFKAGFFGEMQSVFDAAVTALVEAGRADEALEVSERGRARGLLDLVQGRVTASAGREAFVDPLGRPLSAAGIRAALADDTVLLQYHVVAERVHLWVVRRSGIAHTPVDASRAELVRLTRALRQALRTREASDTALASELYRRLVAPARLAPRERVIVVPHDVLHYLPFQALRGPGGYLVEEHPVSYAPSATTAVRLRERPGRDRARVLALGNPDLGSARLALPAAQREVESLSGVYPGAAVYVRGDATKRRFLAEAPGSQVIHLAAHAEVDEIDPLYSVIRLAPSEAGSGDLEAHEVYRLDLGRSSLVVLSACETGLGRVSRGDEIWGFARSFLSAGAPGLVVSLWPVDDESTASLMRVFHRGLREGLPADRALQAAQVELLRAARTAHPFHWASFVLVGDQR